MKSCILIMLLLISISLHGQESVPATPKRELYRIHLFKAAPGKLPDLIATYLNPPPGVHKPSVFRHESGDDWDLLVVYPQGEKAELPAEPNFPEPIAKYRERIMSDYIWHTDTYAFGPPLAEVQKALAVTGNAQKDGTTSGGLYLVEDYTALNGHLRPLEKVIDREMASARATGMVKFEHSQGFGWDFLVIFRYSGWQEYASAETDPRQDDMARKQGFKDSAAIGLELREHIVSHHDTFLGRLQ